MGVVTSLARYVAYLSLCMCVHAHICTCVRAHTQSTCSLHSGGYVSQRKDLWTRVYLDQATKKCQRSC